MKIKVQLTKKFNLEYYNAQPNDVVEVEFEEYVAAVTASEIGNSHIEACKAQAIAARSFAISRGVLRGLTISDSSSNAQAYSAKRYNNDTFPNCLRAAKETEGIVLMYKDRVINSIYTASNGGRTTSSAERWGGTGEPFLIAQDDPWDKAAGYDRSGTGVGMSQRGCIYAANRGIDYKTILTFYYPGTYLSEDYGRTKAMKIVDLARSFMGYPYVFGAVGESCTPKQRDRRKNAAYPTIVSKCQVLSKTKSTCEGCKYEGMQIFDCRGFTYYCLKQVGIEISTVGATTQYNGNYWVQKGLIKDGMPNVVCCVFKHKNSVMSHTGLHIGDGYIIHCSGEVKEGAISDTSWTHYAIPKGLYDDEYLKTAKGVKEMTIYRNGSQGEGVRQLQENLNKLGFDCGKVDGIFGQKTTAAVKAFQRAHNLTDDGIAGPVTLAAIERLIVPQTQEPDPEPIEEPIEEPVEDFFQLKDLQAELQTIKAELSSLFSKVEDFEEELDNFLNK